MFTSSNPPTSHGSNYILSVQCTTLDSRAELWSVNQSLVPCRPKKLRLNFLDRFWSYCRDSTRTCLSRVPSFTNTICSTCGCGRWCHKLVSPNSNSPTVINKALVNAMLRRKKSLHMQGEILPLRIHSMEVVLRDNEKVEYNALLKMARNKISSMLKRGTFKRS